MIQYQQMGQNKQNLQKAIDHPQMFAWSKKRVLYIVTICVVCSVLAVSGFFLVQQYHTSVIQDTAREERVAPPDWQTYHNEYWGIGFKYPGRWNKVVGSFEDGAYYFSSAPINFINELPTGQALIILKTYNNWENLSFEEWFTKQQNTYFPRGEFTVEPASIASMQAKQIELVFTFPKDNVGYWRGYVISRDTATKYMLILATDSKKTAEQYQTQFGQMVNSLTFSEVAAK